MKNNLNKNTEISQKKFKESLKSSNQNILYKSYNDKKNRFKENNNIINKQELSDIKSIVKNSVEKINDLFNLQEMKDNSKISSRKSNEIKSIKNYFDKDNINKNNIKTLKCDEDTTNNSSKKLNKKIMKTNITFKINNYLNVLNKSKNCLNNAVNYRNYVNYGIYSDNSNSKNNINNYLTQKNSTNDINITNNTYVNSTNVNNTNLNITSNKGHAGHNLNLKKNNKKKDIKKNNISNNKNNIKSNILMGIKNRKLKTKINNEYLFLSPKINKDKNKFYFFNDDLNGKNEEINNKNILTEKSIVVNTRYKQNENNKKTYIIKPMKISHINKEIESTLTNENQSRDSKNKTNKSNKSNKSYNSEKRKKYIFLKRTKTKNDISDDQDKKKKKKLIFSQKNTKKKYPFANSRINNYYNNNFYNTREGYYPKKRDKYNINYNSDGDNDVILNINDFNDYLNGYNQCENNNNDLQQKVLNNKIDNELNYNYSPSNDKNNENDIFSVTKEDKGTQTSSRFENINNLLISPISSGSGIDSEYKISHHLSKKCKSDNKLKISKKYNNYKNNKEANPILLNLENKVVSRNNNSYVSSIINNCKKGNKILNLIEKKNLFNSSNKKMAELERNNMRKTLKKIYDTPFPNKVVTNDVFKLFLLLNEYIINNNLLSDYNLNNNKVILNKLSEFLSNYSFIDYPKEYDINIDSYIKSVKTIQRAWRKKKVKQLLERNEEIHELKKIIVNKYITKVGYKMKKIFGLFNSMIEDFNNIENSDDINRMFYYVKNLIKRDLTIYEKNLIYKEFINKFLHLK